MHDEQQESDSYSQNSPPPKNLALWFRQFGSPLQTLTLEAAELRTRPPAQIRVRMVAAPINPSDIIPITGAYHYSVTPPRVAGYEGVGTVVEAEGEAVRLLGQRVLPLRGSGTWQTYVDCDPTWVVPVPDDIPDSIAARSYINPLTAHLMLKSWPVKGKRVLLTGAGSSCAGLLAQWAYLAGAIEVVGVYRSEEHVATLTRFGVVPINMTSLAEIVAASARTDVVFDAVGGSIGTLIISNMQHRSEFVSYGLLSGEPLKASSSGIQAKRFHLRDYLAATTPMEWHQWFQALWPYLRRASLPGLTHFPLEAWREAVALFDRPGRLSKPAFAMP